MAQHRHQHRHRHRHQHRRSVIHHNLQRTLHWAQREPCPLCNGGMQRALRHICRRVQRAPPCRHDLQQRGSLPCRCFGQLWEVTSLCPPRRWQHGWKTIRCTATCKDARHHPRRRCSIIRRNLRRHRCRPHHCHKPMHRHTHRHRCNVATRCAPLLGCCGAQLGAPQPVYTTPQLTAPARQPHPWSCLTCVYHLAAPPPLPPPPSLGSGVELCVSRSNLC